MSSLNDFIVLGKIGQGAYSSVHKVKRISDENIYALKKVKITAMKEKQKENSLNEVRILASINNDHIIGYKEAFFDSKSNALCIIMEFAEGGDLEKVIEKKKRSLSWVSENQIWKMVREVLSGLIVLHEMNIIHRDIKSANIFLSNGKYKVGDMNVSKLLKQDLAYTQTGTPYYASPQVWKDKPYQLKSDIWSLGCVIYEYCSLKPPFTANSMEGLYKKVMKGVYPRIPGSYSLSLEKFIAECLQLEAKNRPSCKQLISMLPPSDKETDTSFSVNLLNTIKMPRNPQSWREQLPKSNYATQLNSANNKETAKHRFGQFSQQKLKQIVRQKNPEGSFPSKKSSIRRITPDVYSQNETGNYHDSSLNDRHRLVEMLEEKQRKKQMNALNALKQELKQIIPKKNDVLPRIKIHSQPTDNSAISYKLREEERNRRYNYNRPAWWG